MRYINVPMIVTIGIPDHLDRLTDDMAGYLVAGSMIEDIAPVMAVQVDLDNVKATTEAEIMAEVVDDAIDKILHNA